MGCSTSTPRQPATPPPSNQGSHATQAIANVYETREEVVAAIREAGVESVNLIVGIDATASNIDMGRETFGGKSLHSFEPGQLNPYEQILWATVPILNEFDDDKKVPVLAFGDQRTKDFGALVLDEAAHGHEGVLQAYRRFLQDERTVLSGPTSFIPVLSWAVDQVRRTRTYTVVLLICDGAVQDVASNSAFLREVVSKYPISVVAVGVGDGRNHPRATPWTALRHFDDNVRAPSRSGYRQVGRDVFQAVMFHQVTANIPPTQVARQRATLAAHVLQEIPAQYKYAQAHRLFDSCDDRVHDEDWARYITRLRLRAEPWTATIPAPVSATAPMAPRM